MTLASELVGRAREIAPLVAREAQQADRNGRVSDAVIDAFADARLFEILVPRRFGGHELSYETMAQVIRAISPACTSTAWVMSFYIGHNYIHALFPEESQKEVFADRPYALTPGAVAPSFTMTPVTGGYRVSGRSMWNSGSSRSDWFMGNGVIQSEGQAPAMRLFLVPTAEATLIPNWDVAGMRATSSSDIALQDTFVPEHRTVETPSVLEGRTPGAALHANPIYGMPLLPFILGEVVPVVVGAYRGAADEFVRLTKARYGTFTGAEVKAKPAAQMRIGHGLAGADLADRMLADYIRELVDPDIERMRSLEARAAMKARVALITDFCYEGIRTLMLGAGANAFRNESPMQRFYRDISMLRVHGFLDLETGTETYGQVLLGMAPTSPI